LFLLSLIRFDVFIFIGRSSFFKLFDLPILKFAGKKICFIFLGSDLRPIILNGRYFQDGAKLKPLDVVKLTRRQIFEVSWIEKWSDIIIAHPPTAHFLRKPFLPYLYIGYPTYIPSVRSQLNINKCPRILHLPSSPETKGTKEIRAAIEKLKKEGMKFDYIELSGVPQSRVIEELNLCDFVIDQVYSDTPMAAFASEAAAFGKPAVVGGYVELKDLGVPQTMIPPSIYVKPEEIYDGIKSAICNTQMRETIGHAAKSFTLAYWNASATAKRLEQVINGIGTPAAMVNPVNIESISGYGQSLDSLKKRLIILRDRVGFFSLGFKEDSKYLNAIKKLLGDD